MKLSTRSRYGTRLILDLAEHYGEGAIQLADIAQRQDLSVKYLEQIIRILKKARYVDSLRGPKGGHKLAKPPETITVGEVVALLEKGKSFVHCGEKPKSCRRIDHCRLARVWAQAADAMFDRLNRITFADLIDERDPAFRKTMSADSPCRRHFHKGASETSKASRPHD